MMSRELEEAYRRTTYVVEVSGKKEIHLRIGERSAALDNLLSDRRMSHWAFVSAFNPRSNRLSDAENAERHQQLVRRVRELGCAMLPGRGVGDNPAWPAEASLLIFQLAPEDARRLAREFEQNAFVVGRKNDPAELLFV
ncbi:MAG: DUF3293 domain-containing protein [Pyrinomonadaceae bacterium]